MTYFIAGGGTGGHLYPALAIAREIVRREPDADVRFIGTARGLEVQIVPKTGFQLHLLTMGSGFARRGWLSRLQTLLSLPLAVAQAVLLILKYRPRWILGVGGYASVPMVLAGVLTLRPTSIWEANAYPGMANRWLSWILSDSFLVFQESAKFLHSRFTHVVGLPVRAEIRARSRASHSRLRVLVFGGSQGARGINQAVIDGLSQLGELADRVAVIHQTGAQDFDRVTGLYRDLRKSKTLEVDVKPYLDSIQEQYAWADLVICRAGASTIAELATSRKAAMLIPFPFATDDHQTKNAQALQQAKAAILIAQRDFDGPRFVKEIREFLNFPERITELESRIAAFDSSKAASLIVDHLCGKSPS